MAEDWYCQINGEEQGPFSSLELREMARERMLVPGAQVRKGKTGTWQAASAIKGLFPKHAAAEEAEEESPGGYTIEETLSCPGCGKALPKNAVLCVSCGYDLKAGRSLKTKYGGKPRVLRINQGFKGFALCFLLSLPFLLIPFPFLVIPSILGTFTIVAMTRDKKNRPVCQVEKRICFLRLSHKRAVLTEHDSLVTDYEESNLGFLLFFTKLFLGTADSRFLEAMGDRIEPSRDGRIEIYKLKLKLLGKNETIPLCRADRTTMLAIIDLIQGVVRVQIERG